MTEIAAGSRYVAMGSSFGAGRASRRGPLGAPAGLATLAGNPEEAA